MARLQDLTKENRIERSSARERAVLALRHDIAVKRLRDPGSLHPVEPSAAPSEFEDDLPVVQGTMIDASVVRAAITQYGSLLVRHLIPRKAARRLVSVIDRVFDGFDAGDAQNEWFSPFPGRDDSVSATRAWLRTKGGILTGDSPRATFEVAEVFTDAGIDRLAEAYLGQPPIISLDKWTIRRGTFDNGIEWHQDGAFLGERVSALNVWLALSACGTDAPSLDVIPRRLDEIVSTGTEGASYSWSVAEDVAIRVAGPEGWRRPRFGPGDALLFDEKLLHRTGGDATMPQRRYAIETWFFAPSGDTDYIDVPLVL
jgi:hypothetical protein